MQAKTIEFGRAWLDGSRARAFTAFDRLSAVLAAIALVANAIEPMDASAVMQQNTGAKSSAAPAAGSAREAPATALGRETLVAFYSGAPYTYPSEVHVKKEGVHDFTIKDVEWIGEPFKSPIYYGVRVARWFDGGRTGTMLDFTHSKATAVRELEADMTGTLDGKPAPARSRIDAVFDKLEATHGHNMLTLNGLLRLPSLGARLSPYVGAGAGISLPHSEVYFKGENVRTYEYQYTGPVLQGLFGIELRAAQASFFIEYKFSYAPYTMPLTQQDGFLLFTDLWRQFNRWVSGEKPAGGTLETTLSSHQLIGGLGIRLVPASAVGQ